MSIYRPGEFRITDRALEKMNLPKGAHILEIGCGEGETLAYLSSKGYIPQGLDLDPQMVEKAKEKNPDLKISKGDGEFLDGYSSYTFDAVIMECVLSMINLPDEALHEIFCVLKRGGKLYFSDLLLKNPDKELLERLDLEAKEYFLTPRPEGSCSHDDHDDHDHHGEDSPVSDSAAFHSSDCASETSCSDCSLACPSAGGNHESSESGSYQDCDHDHDHENEEFPAPEDASPRPVSFRFESRLLVEPLLKELAEIGYTSIYWEDCSKELDSFVAETLMQNGSLDSCFCPIAKEQGRSEQLEKSSYKTGYFMLVAEKPIN